MDIVTLCSALDVYAIENEGHLPATLMVLVTPDAHGRTYLKDRTTVPLDPWKNPYLYEPPADERRYRVYSLGADGVPGGTGDDDDIDSLEILATQGR